MERENMIIDHRTDTTWEQNRFRLKGMKFLTWLQFNDLDSSQLSCSDITSLKENNNSTYSTDVSMLITIIMSERLQMWSEQSAGPDFSDFFWGKIFKIQWNEFKHGRISRILLLVAKRIMKLWLAYGSANQVLRKN